MPEDTQRRAPKEAISAEEYYDLKYLTRKDAVGSLKWFITTFIGAIVLIVGIALNLHADVSSLKKDASDTHEQIRELKSENIALRASLNYFKEKIDSVLMYQKVEAQYRRR